MSNDFQVILRRVQLKSIYIKPLLLYSAQPRTHMGEGYTIDLRVWLNKIACFDVSSLRLELLISRILRLSEALSLSMPIMTAVITVFFVSASLSIGLVLVSFLLIRRFTICPLVPFLSAVVAVSLESFAFIPYFHFEG